MEQEQLLSIINSFEAKFHSGPKELIPPSLAKELKEEEEVLVKFSLGDAYNKKLFIALARKHGFKPYRQPRQKHTTVMLKGKKSYIDHVLWPEFELLSQELNFFLEQVSNEIIRNVIIDDISDIHVEPSRN